MLFLKYLYRDIKYGIIKRLYTLIPIIIVVIFMFIKWDMYLDYLSKQGCIIKERNLLDSVFFLFEGMAVYRFDPRSFFNPPMLWLVFNIIILYFTAYYPQRDFGCYGKTVFVAGKSRKLWWISKMLWCAVSVVICYLAAYLGLVIGTIIKGYKMSFATNTDFQVLQYGNGIRYLSSSDVVIVVIILPVVVSIVLCELQMILSFVLTPVISFAVMISFFVVSAFYTVWWLLPNYTMWRRSAYYDYKGLLPSDGFLLSGYILLAVFIVGVMHFSQRDII